MSSTETTIGKGADPDVVPSPDCIKILGPMTRIYEMKRHALHIAKIIEIGMSFEDYVDFVNHVDTKADTQ